MTNTPRRQPDADTGHLISAEAWERIERERADRMARREAARRADLEDNQ